MLPLAAIDFRGALLRIDEPTFLHTITSIELELNRTVNLRRALRKDFHHQVRSTLYVFLRDDRSAFFGNIQNIGFDDVKE